MSDIGEITMATKVSDIISTMKIDIQCICKETIRI